MEKKYTEYLEEISSDELYEGLLGHGMFANKFDPGFFDEAGRMHMEILKKSKKG